MAALPFFTALRYHAKKTPLTGINTGKIALFQRLISLNKKKILHKGVNIEMQDQNDQ
jgi:hypothetical protein